MFLKWRESFVCLVIQTGAYHYSGMARLYSVIKVVIKRREEVNRRVKYYTMLSQLRRLDAKPTHKSVQNLNIIHSFN